MSQHRVRRYDYDYSRLTVFEQRYIYHLMTYGNKTEEEAFHLLDDLRQKMTWAQCLNEFHKYELTHSPKAFLVYRYRDTIKVKAGLWGHNFYPLDKNDHVGWHTGIPHKEKEVTSKGKVIVTKEEDIPEAIEMIKNYYLKKKGEVISQAISSIVNLEKVIYS